MAAAIGKRVGRGMDAIDSHVLAIGKVASLPKRAIYGTIVVLLHAVLVYILFLGLTLAPAPKAQNELTMVLDTGGTRAVRGAPPLPDPPKPEVPVVMPPDIAIDDTPQNTISVQAPTGGPGATVPAEAVGEAHTVPQLTDALLALARHALLRLKLTIATDGSVSDAMVDSSSGSTDVDKIAVAWVKAHWRYKPAMRDGAPISVTTSALVPF